MITRTNANAPWLIVLIVLMVNISLLFLLSCGRSDEDPAEQSYAGQDENTGVAVNTDNTGGKNQDILFTIDRMPEFPGGQQALEDFISKNIRYPESARKAGKQGKVYISFTVDDAGKVTDVKVKRGICQELDAEALRVVKLMPAWEPGAPGKVSLTLPINFRLAMVNLPLYQILT